MAKIEEMLKSLLYSSQLRFSIDFLSFFYLPAEKAVEYSAKLMKIIKSINYTADPITITILEVLISKGEVESISELYSEVKRLRGTASKYTIYQRLRQLEKLGVIEIKRSGKEVKLKLKW